MALQTNFTLKELYLHCILLLFKISGFKILNNQIGDKGAQAIGEILHILKVISIGKGAQESNQY